MRAGALILSLVLILPVTVVLLADPAGAQTVSTQVGAQQTVSFAGRSTGWALLTATAALIAFHIGLFTLVGRERKSPYIINLIYPIFLLCLFVATLAVVSVLLPPNLEQPVLLAGVAFLAITVVFSFVQIWRIAIRSVYFVDSIHIKHLPGIRHLRRWKSLRSPRPNYAHNPLPIPQHLQSEIIKILSDAGEKEFEHRQELELRALALGVQHQGQGNELLAQLASAFLKESCSVQYLTASRHPIEFLGYLISHLEKRHVDWPACRKRVVVIDAYSSHFAFLDSIYPKKDRALESLDVTCVKSKMTYAGIHTASAKAFNAIKKQINDQDRHPTLVIYEDTYALADLESAEQYRIFVRHVMPSERMWDGMFTVFLESSMPEADWRMLQGYASMRVDLRAGSTIAERTSASSSERSVPDRHYPDKLLAASALNDAAKERNR